MKKRKEKNEGYKKVTVMTLIMIIFFTTTNAGPFMTVDGRGVNHVKHCLFHEQIYESHFSPDVGCSFNVNQPPPNNAPGDLTPPSHIAHDPECFGEQNIPLN